MPKISDDRKAERRGQILAGARKVFAEAGYEGATVAKLEREIGLSRGAIFNYFGSKEDLFLELAYRDNATLIGLWMEKGWETALREIATEDPAWLGVYLEVGRKIRTDPDFRRRHAERLQQALAPPLVAHIRSEQERGELRSDQPAERVAGFIGLVANGVSVQVALGEPVRDVDALVEFVRAAVGASAARGRARSGTPARRRA